MQIKTIKHYFSPLTMTKIKFLKGRPKQRQIMRHDEADFLMQYWLTTGEGNTRITMTIRMNALIDSTITLLGNYSEKEVTKSKLKEKGLKKHDMF
jgi:hypothetical protein